MSESLMTPEQVAEAWSRYESGWSLRRLADDGWEHWGYVSFESARAALRLAFSRAGFKLRTVQDAMRLLYAPSFQDRFWSKVEKHDVDCSCCNGCWHWRGARLRWGHGQFSVNGTCMRAHRVAYELLVGPIPDGLALDHLCRNAACVNPAHLEPVTVAENSRRIAQPPHPLAVAKQPTGEAGS